MRGNVMSLTVRAEVSLIVFIFCITVTATSVVAQNNDITKRYPPERYLVRQGLGETPESASEAARLEIAKYFESKISGESIVKEWAESRTVKGKTSQKYVSELSNTIKVSAEREIPGIEITGAGKNKKFDAYETWAVLEKSAYVSVLTDRIQKLDSEIDQALKTQGNDLSRLKNLNKALKSLIAREQDRGDLRLLTPGGAPESKSAILQGVITSIDSLVSGAFDVGLVFEGEVESKIRSGLLKAVVDAGIRVKEYRLFTAAIGAGTDLVIEVKHDSTPNTRKQKVGSREFEFFSVSWVLSVNAYDPKTTEVIDTIVQKENVQNVGGGEIKAQEDMVRKILQDQVPAVTSWVYGLIFQPAEN